MISTVKPKLSKLINAIAKPFVRIDPNILSLLGLIPPILFILFMISKQYIPALFMFVGLLLDTIDGAVARMTGKSSAFGGFLDSSLDRVSDALFIWAFALAGLVRYEFVIVAMFLSLFISYLRSRAELAGKGNITLAVGIVERPERLIMLFIALLLNVIWPSVKIFESMNLTELTFVVLIFLSFVTIFQRLVMAFNKLKTA